MRLHRIKVSNFRRFSEPVEIAELDPELTVIAGDNEAGKSTLLAALRAAFFDRYKLTGGHAESFLPLGCQVAPEIWVDFSVNGGRYALYKRFGQGKTAELICPDGAKKKDDAADEALEQLLGFTRPGKGGSSAEHQGIWGTLWVQQGSMFQPVLPFESARRSLEQVLEAEVGSVLDGGRGQAVLDRLAREKGQYWTGGGKPTGDYRSARATLDQLEQELATLEAEHAGYEHKVDELTEAEARLRQFQQDDVLGQCRRQLEAAEQEARKVDEYRRAVQEAEGRHQLAQVTLGSREQAWRDRQAMQRAIEAARGRVDAAAAALKNAQADHGRYKERLAEVNASWKRAQEAETTARNGVEALTAREQRQELARRLRAAEETLAQAREAARRLGEARAAAEANPVDEPTLTRLRKLSQELALAEARLQTGAPHVAFELSVPVTAEGAAHAVADGYRVAGQARFLLEGVGAVTVTAVGEELVAQSERRAQLTAELEQALAAADVADLAAAERLAEDRRRQLQQLESEQARLRAYAPEGIEVLARELESLQARVDGLRDTGSAEEVDGEALHARIAQARAELVSAHDAARAATKAQETAAAEENAARIQLAESSVRLESEQKTLHQAQQRLQEAQATLSDDALYAEMRRGQTETAEAEAAAAEARQRLHALDPELTQARLKRARQALAGAEEDAETQRLRVHALRAELKALGARGLAEKLEECQRQRLDAERRWRALEREAHAVRVAHEALAAVAAEARQTFLEPVARRVQHYLRGLIPEALPVLGEGLGLKGIQRGALEQSFDVLSVGTREQLAIVTRIAFADLLADHGQHVPIILDDAMVYADDGRFKRMLDVLIRAAERHQVIILTCHESAYRALGGKLLRLEGQRTAASTGLPAAS